VKPLLDKGNMIWHSDMMWNFYTIAKQ